MFEINEDKTINITRGDIGAFTVDALNEAGEKYLFQKGDVVRIKVTEKKACENVMFQKDFVVEEETEQVEILLTEQDTKIGEVISKPTDYWYEIELNPLTNPQTIIGYDEDGAKILRLYPEGNDIEPVEPTPEDIPVVDTEFDLTSERPVQNHVIARAILNLQEEITKIDTDVNITSEDLEPLAVGIEENKSNIAKNTGSIEDLTNTLDTHTADKNNPHNVTAEQVSIDNSTSGLSANNVQGAIDEISRTLGYTVSKNELKYPYYAYVGSGYSQFVNGNVFTYQGVSYTDNNSIITANGTATSTSYCYLRHRTNENYSLKKGKYILNGCPKGGSDSTYYIDIGKTGVDGNFELIGKDYGDGVEFELEEDTNNIAVTIVIANGYKANNLVFKPMISKEGGEFEAYVPSVKSLICDVEVIDKMILCDVSTTQYVEHYRFTAKRRCILNLSATAVYSNSIPKRLRMIKNNTTEVSVCGYTAQYNLQSISTSTSVVLNKGDYLTVETIYNSVAKNNIILSGYAQYLE